jgi:anti-sigma factor RsiW
MTRVPVAESDLHALIDGVLPAARAAEVEAYLAAHPEEAARVAAYRQHVLGLRQTYNAVLDEEVPERLRRPVRAAARWPRLAAAAVAGLIVGGIGGWYLHALTSDPGVEAAEAGWARRAAMAHIVYSPEVRHPVEVGADQETHLVNWLSKRLGTRIKVPHLGGVGYSLVGGRLLPGERGPVAQFMYQDAKGQRLTLYVRVTPDDARETAFRYTREHDIGVFYWVDQKLGYALSGEVEKDELLRVATAVYRQLNP